MQHGLGAAGHALVFGGRLFRARDRDQFDLLELVLADHAAGVAAMAAGFGAETHRMRGHAQRQRGVFDDAVAHDVGQRHFAGGDQVTAVVTEVGGEQVVFELGQLAGTAQAVGVDDQRHVGFFVAVFAGVQVQHELGQGPVQARQRAAQHGETGAAELGGGVAVEPAVAGAQLDVVLHREIEGARRAPAKHFEVVLFVGAGRHAGVGQVGNGQGDRLELGAQFVQAGLGGLEFVGDAGDLGHQRGHVFTLGLGLADGLGAGIAQVLQLLRAALDGLALGLEAFERGHVEVETPGLLQARSGVGKMATQQVRVEHGVIP